MARKRVAETAAIVLDSSLLIAYHNERDTHHSAAVRAMANIAAGRWGRALLLEYVFLEVVTVLLGRRGVDLAVTVGNGLLEAREIDFVPCGQLFAPAWQLFAKQADTTLSFTDAAIVVAARVHAAGRVATFDRDFQDIRGITVVTS